MYSSGWYYWSNSKPQMCLDRTGRCLVRRDPIFSRSWSIPGVVGGAAETTARESKRCDLLLEWSTVQHSGKWTRVKSCNYIVPLCEQNKQRFAAALHQHVPVHSHICGKMLLKVFFFFSSTKNFAHLRFLLRLLFAFLKRVGLQACTPLLCTGLERRGVEE